MDISIQDELAGLIKFDGHDLLDKKRMLNELHDAAHGTTNCLTIEQRLSPSEVKAISEAEAEGKASFDLSHLVIMITGGAHSPEVVHRPLKIEGIHIAAFPRSYWQIAQCVHALGRVRGGGDQLGERLRVLEDALPRTDIENWKEGARRLLERTYGEVRALEIFKEIFNAPIPDTNALQSEWLHNCLNYVQFFFDRELNEVSTLQRSNEERSN